MDEKNFFKELQQYEKKYRENIYIDAFYSFLKRYGRDSFFKELEAGHITASGWLVDKNFEETLLVYHKKLKKLIQPGGHCERSDDSVRLAALRELREETALQDIIPVNNDIFHIAIHEVSTDTGKHLHYDVCYLFTCNNKQMILSSEESDYIKWYPLEDLKYMEHMDITVLEMAEKTKMFWS